MSPNFWGISGDGLSAFDIAKRGGGMGNTVIRALVEILWPQGEQGADRLT